MNDATGGDWRTSLAAVEQGIDDCLAALGRYEAAFARVLGEPIALPEPRPLPPPIDWDDKLASSVAAADEVEELLAVQESAWRRWRSALTNWRTAATGA